MLIAKAEPAKGPQKLLFSGTHGLGAPASVRFWESPPHLHELRSHQEHLAILSAVMPSVLDLFKETGAYLHGHFRLTSGLHSGEYLQCAKVLAHPAHAEELGRSLAAKVKLLIADLAIDAVVAPAMGGIIIGHEVARAFGTLSLFTERDAATNEMTLRRGFEIKAGQTVGRGLR